MERSGKPKTIWAWALICVSIAFLCLGGLWLFNRSVLPL